LKIAIDGSTLQFPVLIDGKPGRATQSVLVDPGTAPGGVPSAYKLHVCLPPTSATGGLRLVWLDLDTSAFRNPASRQTYEWNTVVQSYGADGNPDPSSRFEVRSMVPLPEAVTFTTRYDRAQRATVFSGLVTWAGTPHANARVYLLWSATQSFRAVTNVGSLQTGANGRFTFTKRLRKPGWLSATVALAGGPACGVGSFDVPCVFLTYSPPPDAVRRLGLP
jgi:hypothetical protein